MRAILKLASELIRVGEHERAVEALTGISETSPQAQYNLSILYYKGLGVKPSLKTALHYARMAQSGGYDKADELVAKYEQKMGELDLFKEMIVEEIMEKIAKEQAVSDRIDQVSPPLFESEEPLQAEELISPDLQNEENTPSGKITELVSVISQWDDSMLEQYPSREYLEAEYGGLSPKEEHYVDESDVAMDYTESLILQQKEYDRKIAEAEDEELEAQLKKEEQEPQYDLPEDREVYEQTVEDRQLDEVAPLESGGKEAVEEASEESNEYEIEEFPDLEGEQPEIPESEEETQEEWSEIEPEESGFEPVETPEPVLSDSAGEEPEFAEQGASGTEEFPDLEEEQSESAEPERQPEEEFEALSEPASEELEEIQGEPLESELDLSEAPAESAEINGEFEELPEAETAQTDLQDDGLELEEVPHGETVSEPGDSMQDGARTGDKDQKTKTGSEPVRVFDSEKIKKTTIGKINIADKFLMVQGIFITAFIAISAMAYFFFNETKANFEDFRNQELTLLEKSNEITRDLSSYKTLIMIASLRKGDDFMEMQKIETSSRKVMDKVIALVTYARPLNDSRIDELTMKLEDEFDKFTRLGSMMPEDFKESFEEGIDSLGAVDSINERLVQIIGALEKRIEQRASERTEKMGIRLDEAMLYILIVGGISILVSFLVYKLSSQLKNINKTLDNMVEERTRELHSTLALLKEYSDAIDRSMIVAKINYLGEIEHVNDLFKTVSGYGDELIGTNMGDINVYDTEVIGGPHRRWGEILTTLISEKEWDGVLTFRTKNGKLFYVQTTISPIESSEGEVIEFLAIMQDITELENSRINELADSVDKALDIKLDQVVGYVPLPAVVLNKDSVVCEYNDAFKALFDMFEDEAYLESLEKHELVFDSLMLKKEGMLSFGGNIDWKMELTEFGDEEDSRLVLKLSGEEKEFGIAARNIDKENGTYLVTLSV